MKVLVACEESQRVCIAFRNRGFEAYSCDIQPCSGGHPEWHIQDDCLKYINSGEWNLIIAHPPCTYLSNVCTREFSLRVTPPEKVVQRWENRAKAVAFFMQFIGADCKHIAVENPVGFMSTAYRKPDQYINPWMFAEGSDDSENYCSKKTGLWLKNLPLLKGNNKIAFFNNGAEYGYYTSGKAKTWEDIAHGSTKRSKTFPGIAEAMAQQWGDYILKEAQK